MIKSDWTLPSNSRDQPNRPNTAATRHPLPSCGTSYMRIYSGKDAGKKNTIRSWDRHDRQTDSQQSVPSQAKEPHDKGRRPRIQACRSSRVKSATMTSPTHATVPDRTFFIYPPSPTHTHLIPTICNQKSALPNSLFSRRSNCSLSPPIKLNQPLTPNPKPVAAPAKSDGKKKKERKKAKQKPN